MAMAQAMGVAIRVGDLDADRAYAAGRSMGPVLDVLLPMRCRLSNSEFDLHAEIERALSEAMIGFRREVRVGPGSRIDFLVDGGIGIEVKRGKRCSSEALARQIERYLESDQVEQVVVVTERSMVTLLDRLTASKPVCVLSLSKQWGVAL